MRKLQALVLFMLIFIKPSGEQWLAVDEWGVVHRTSQVDPHLPLSPGTVCDALVTMDSAGEYRVEHDYPYSTGVVLKLKASFEEAPYAFARWLLDNTLYSGNAAYATSEYILKDVQIEQTYGLGRIDAAKAGKSNDCMRGTGTIRINCSPL